MTASQGVGRGFSRLRTRMLALLTVVVCSVTTGCSVGLGQLPLPAPGISGEGFALDAEFRNALNLPARAKVRLLGADVGYVEEMSVNDYLARVRLRITDGTRLPAGTRAELRSATPLGDVFVALEPPADAPAETKVLADGDVIDVDHTSAGATVEEVLSTAAMLVNGGALRNLTDIVNGLGDSLGDGGDQLGTLVRQSRVLVSSLSERTGEIEAVLASAGRLASTVSARQQTIDTAIEAAGPALWTVANNTQSILDTVDQVDRIIGQLAKFPSVKGTAAGGMMADINQIAASLNAAATAPGASLAAVNRILGPIVKLTNATSGHTDVAITQFAIGAFDDPNHRGDPGSRLPDAGDWQHFAGSLAVTLMRIRQHVEPGRPAGAPR